MFHINKKIYLVTFVVAFSLIACSFSGIQQQAQKAEQSVNSSRTEVSGMINTGKSVISTAQAIRTSSSGILATVQAITTQAEPFLSTIQAVATDNPGLVQTAQSLISKEIPTGEPPSDIPIYNQDQAENYYGSSQNVFYISPAQFSQVLEFYQAEMPDKGWQFLQSNSHEDANFALISYEKDNRIATINLSMNPLNNTAAVVITLANH